MKNKNLVFILLALAAIASFASTALAGTFINKTVPVVWVRNISGTDAFNPGNIQPIVSTVLDGRHNSSNMTVATSLALQDTSQWIDVRDHYSRQLLSTAVGASGPLGVPDSVYFGTVTFKTTGQTLGTAGVMDTLVILRDYSYDGLGSTSADSLTSHVWTDSLRVPGVVAVDSITITATPTLAANSAGQVIRYFSYSWPCLPGVATMTSKGASPVSNGFNFIRFRVHLTGGDAVALSGTNPAVQINTTFSYPAQEPNYNK